MFDALIIAFNNSLEGLAEGVLAYGVRFLLAIVAFIIIYIVAVVLGKLVEQVVKSLKVDSLLQSLGAEEPLERAGYKVNTGAFLGGLVRWFFIVLALLVAVEALGLDAVSEFLSGVVLNYIPNVIVAAVIIIAGAVLATAAQKVIKGSAQAASMPAATVIGAVAKWSIWIFAILAALFQLGVVPSLIQTIVTAFVAMLALAGGIAFGLGGKEAAEEAIARLRREIHE